MRWVAVTLFTVTAALLANAGSTSQGPNAEEQILQAAGLKSDGAALREFFRERTRPEANLKELLQIARQLGDASAPKRVEAKAKLLACGPWAIPALRHVINDLENPLAAQNARHCLDWIEGEQGNKLLIAAAHLLPSRAPAEAAETLLAFLPFAGDPKVASGVQLALVEVAARPGKTDAALLAALADPMPLRRAVVAEVLASSGRPGAVNEVRKLLTDPQPQVRLCVALSLSEHLDEKAIVTLIDLLVDLPAKECRQAEQALQQLAGAWTPTPLSTTEDDLSRKLCREAWAAWWRTTDAEALTAAFRKRTLNEEELAAARALVEHLGSSVFQKRERAAAELIAQGTKVAELLREASKRKDPELAQRAENCLKSIAKNDSHDRLPLTAPRLLAIRRPAGAAEPLLAFLPFADDLAMSAEVVNTLTRLIRETGKPDAAVIKALGDPMAVRRIAAAEALIGAGNVTHPSLRKRLGDGDLQVRLQVALALVQAHDREAVPALIDLVGELPIDRVSEVEEVLRVLAGGKAPVRLSMEDPEARKKLKAAWLDWWKEHGGAVNLAAMTKTNLQANLIVVAELGPRGTAGKAKGFPGFGPGGFPGGGINPPDGFVPGKGKGGDAVPPNPPEKGGPGKAAKKRGGLLEQPAPKGKKGGPVQLPGGPANPNAAGTDRIVAVDRSGKMVWQIEGLDHPKDFQVLPNGHVLIAEYYSNRVTERDLTGKIVWAAEKLPAPPMNVQRLANGNTFIAMYGSIAVSAGYYFVELDRQGKTVATFNGGPGGPGGIGLPGALGRLSNPRAGFKMANGQMIALAAPGTAVRLDASGKELNRFVVPLQSGGGVPSVVGNIEVTPKGNLIIAQNNNAVGEYDPDGKVVWQVQATGNRATRLANGNTLVASESTGVFELNPTGKSVWEYHPPAGYVAVRARQMGR